MSAALLLTATEARDQSAGAESRMHQEFLQRGFAWLGSFTLDLRLAIRMLARYPGLTLVGCAAMAFGIAAAVGVFEIRTQLVAPSLPLDQGSRIVGFRNYDASLNRPVLTNPYDFVTWDLGMVRDLGMAKVQAGLYFPIAPDATPVLRTAVNVRGTPASFAARLRAVASEVEPTLQIHELMPLDEAGASLWLESRYLSRVLAILSAIALLLSLTAIYSVAVPADLGLV